MAASRRWILFCNEGYGAPYEAAFREWTARKSAEALIVKSERRRFRRGRGLRPRVRRAAWRAELAWRNRRALASAGLVYAPDVNDAHFLDRYVGTDRETVGLVAGFDQIFRPHAIDRFGRFYNFHPSILPYYRGPVPSHWCIANGERRTGVTVHAVAPEIDAGEILWQTVVPIETDDERALDAALARAGAGLLTELLGLLDAGREPERRTVDGTRVYRELVDYRSFPGPGRKSA